MKAIRTKRLVLRPCSFAEAKAISRGEPDVGTYLGAQILEEWPSPALKAYLPFYIEALDRDADRLGWGVWLVISVEKEIVIGDITIKGKPDPQGHVEIAYGIHSSQRHEGYGYEAVRALVESLLSTPEINGIYAQCRADNQASIRLLQKLGMNQVRRAASPFLTWSLTRTVSLCERQH